MAGVFDRLEAAAVLLEDAENVIKARDAQLFEAEREIKSLREQLDITLTALRSINTLASRHAPK